MSIYVMKEPHEYYLRAPGVSASDLKLIKKSPSHYIQAKQEAKKETQAMALGTAFHTAVMEPHLFNGQYGSYDEGKRLEPTKNYTNKANQDHKKDFYQAMDKAGKKVLTMDETITVLEMGVKVRAIPLIKDLLDIGKIETSHYFTCPRTGLTRKLRPDLYSAEAGILVDFKKAQDASPEGFGRASANYDYPMSMAYYKDGLEHILDKPIKDVFLVAIEDQAPYRVGIYRIKDEDLQLGQYQYLAYLDRYKLCHDNNNWPGYEYKADNELGILDLELPAYYGKKEIVI